MISNMAAESGDMPPDVRDKAKQYFEKLEAAIVQAVDERRFPRGIFPALRPCNFLCILSQRFVHAVFTVDDAGQLPMQRWIDSRNRTIPSDPEYKFVSQYARYELGFRNGFPFYEAAGILDADEDAQLESARTAAREYVEIVMKELTRPKAIAGYEGLQPALDAFSADYPRVDKKVFMSMPFVRLPCLKRSTARSEPAWRDMASRATGLMIACTLRMATFGTTCAFI